jgi:hypothetical protein
MFDFFDDLRLGGRFVIAETDHNLSSKSERDPKHLTHVRANLKTSTAIEVSLRHPLGAPTP